MPIIYICKVKGFKTTATPQHRFNPGRWAHTHTMSSAPHRHRTPHLDTSSRLGDGRTSHHEQRTPNHRPPHLDTSSSRGYVRTSRHGQRTPHHRPPHPRQGVRQNIPTSFALPSPYQWVAGRRLPFLGRGLFKISIRSNR